MLVYSVDGTIGNDLIFVPANVSDVVVTGTGGEGTERSKVPYAVSRLTTEDLPVPSIDPITALAEALKEAIYRGRLLITRPSAKM